MVEGVDIPMGSAAEELWQIFDCISSQVAPGEEVAFDITHGLRHHPLLGLLAAIFLRSGLDIDLKAVLYGAFDVGMQVSQGVTPMFDLTPLLTLLEWSVAADRFNRTGDANYLASLLLKQRKGLAQSAGKDKGKLSQVGDLGRLANDLIEISQSLRLIRPVLAMQKISGLGKRIENAIPILNESAATHPFSLLLDRVGESFASLGFVNPLSPETIVESIAKQRRIITWYVEHEQWVQAISLSREWLVNWFMIHLKINNLVQKDARQRVEGVVNAEAYDLKQAKQAKIPFSPLFLNLVPEIEVALNLWNSLTDVRNDIDHAGMREQPKDPDVLIQCIRQIVETLNTLPVEPR